MRSWSQTIVVLIAFMALVGGITFVAQSIRTKSQEPEVQSQASPTQPARGIGLNFAAAPDSAPAETEVGATGLHDFWFENPYPSAVEVGLVSKSSTDLQIEMFTFTLEERKHLRQWPPSSEQSSLTGHLLGDHGRWQALKDQSKVTVPSQASGAIRLIWQVHKHGPKQLIARLWMRKRDEPATLTNLDLEQRVIVVPALMVKPARRQMPDLEPGAEQSVNFLCFSTTRPQFRLRATVKDEAERQNDPHFACAWRPLNGEECRRLGRSLDVKGTQQVLSGYVVTVTAHELVGQSNHLDMGPFRRQVVLTDAGKAQATATVTGRVRGDFVVGDPEDRGQCDLGKFNAAEGTTKTVPIESSKSQLELEIHHWYPGYLKVQLDQGKPVDGGKRWLLSVTVPPQALSGELAARSAIILKTKEAIPRRMRIPVKGIAYR